MLATGISEGMEIPVAEKPPVGAIREAASLTAASATVPLFS